MYQDLKSAQSVVLGPEHLVLPLSWLYFIYISLFRFHRLLLVGSFFRRLELLISLDPFFPTSTPFLCLGSCFLYFYSNFILLLFASSLLIAILLPVPESSPVL